MILSSLLSSGMSSFASPLVFAFIPPLNVSLEMNWSTAKYAFLTEKLRLHLVQEKYGVEISK